MWRQQAAWLFTENANDGGDRFRIVDGSPLHIIPYTMYFADPQFEKQYLEWAEEQDVTKNTQMLLFTNIVFFISYLLGFIVDTRPAGLSSRMNFFTLFAIFVLLLVRRKPRYHFYMPVLIFCYLRLVILRLPGIVDWDLDALVKPCDAMAQVTVHDYEYVLTHFGRFFTRGRRNCSMLGSTSVLTWVSFIFISPHLFPSLRSMFWITMFWCLSLMVCSAVSQNLERCGMSRVATGTLQGLCDDGEWYFLPHEVVSRLFMPIVLQLMMLVRKSYMVKSERKKYVDKVRQREASQKMFHILEYMVPVHLIVKMIQDPGAIIADQVNRASILFIMIVDFDYYTRTLEPEHLLQFLNRYFGEIDRICIENGVTKIETVSEEYVAAVGVVPEDAELERLHGGHSFILGRLASAASEILDMGSEAADKLQFKMGMHTGPVVAGVIGQKLPRFRLFGDTINTAARMMQKGLPGHLQMGEATRCQLPGDVTVSFRGEVEMKGKGMVKTYLLDRHQVNPQLTEPTVPKETPGVLSLAPSSSGVEETTVGSVEIELPRLISKEVAAPLLQLRQSTRSRAESSQPRSILRRTRSALPDDEDSPQKKTSLAAVSQSRTTRMQLFKSIDSLECGRTSSFAAEEQEQAMERFEDALAQVQAKHDALLVDDAPRTWWMQLSSGLCGRPQKFSPEEEKAWMTYFHDGHVAKKFRARMERQTFLYSVYALLTTGYFVSYFSGDYADDDLRAGHGMFGTHSFPALVIAHLFMTFSCLWLRISADTEWFLKDPTLVQRWLVVVHIVITFCLFIVHNVLEEESRLHASNFETGICKFCESFCRQQQGNFSSEDWKEMCETEAQRIFSSSVPEAEQCRIGMQNSTLTMIRKERDSNRFFEPKIFFVFFMNISIQWHHYTSDYSYVFIIVSAMIAFLLLVRMGNYAGFNNHDPDDDSEYHGMYFAQEELIFVVLNSVTYFMTALHTERSSRLRFTSKRSLDSTRIRIESILNTLMPPRVIEELQETGAPPSHKYGYATIAQSDLCGFTKLASTRPPYEVVKFIGEIFGLFDELCDEHEVYKVETVGDAYIAGQAGWPLTQCNSPVNVVHFGLDMIRTVHMWARENGEEVSCRVGVHTGSCVGGIVGNEMQRYHLFGDLMTVLELLESTSVQGRVQVSTACRTAAQRQIRQENIRPGALVFEERREPHLSTSKNDVVQYDEVGGRTFLVRRTAMLVDRHRG